MWNAFWRIDARRSSNGFSANAISPAEIEAWFRMAGIRLRPWELNALDELEVIRLEWLNREQKEDEVVEGQPVTPALVQALFGKKAS